MRGGRGRLGWRWAALWAAVVLCGIYGGVAAQDARPPQTASPAAQAPVVPPVPAVPAPLAEDIFETVVKVPVTVKLPTGAAHSGEFILTHYHPPGDGPFPLVIMNHGRGVDRTDPRRFRAVGSVRYWIRRGFAVLVPTRLGYGDSGVTPDPETAQRSCAGRSFDQALAAMLAHVDATLGFAASMSWADLRRVIVMGQSYGGFLSIGASGHEIPGLIAAINFAGGGGGNPKTRTANPCGGDQLTGTVVSSGRKAKVPMLWLYAENDKFWGAEWPRRWHAAYTGAGGRAELVMFPPVGEDGHKLIGEGFPLWRPVVDRFLAERGFLPPKSKDAPSQTGFAPLQSMPKVTFVNEKSREEGYARFLNGDLPRAFALSPSGAWGSITGGKADAPAVALQECQKRAKSTCRLYAVDDAVVWRPDARADR